MTDIDLDSLAELLQLSSQPDLDLVIEGRAVTKGSGKAVKSKSTGKPVFLLDNAADQKEWSQIVRGIVRTWTRGEMGWAPVASISVRLSVDVALPRDARQGRATLTAIEHTTKPDVDKLARCLLDALTGLLYVDDSQVNDLHIAKRYVEPGEEPGVRLRAWIGET